MKIYTIFDKVAQEHSQLFEFKNDDVAKRFFAVQTEKTPDPDSFGLFRVGFVDRHDREIKIVPSTPVELDVSSLFDEKSKGDK